MYLEFFGLERPPFNITPDSRFLYLSRRHREALASLEYGITSRQGFIVLTGAIGAGKTTLCRSLLRSLPDSTKIALVLNSYLSDSELLQTINDELGIEYSTDGGKKGLIDALNGRLIEELAQNNAVVLVIDEAQNLAPATLEQVRMLSNLETESDKLLQIVLMGQPELRDTLKLPELEQLNQRITVRYHLLPLSHEEVREYIEHRLNVAGENHQAEFDDGAIEAIWEYAAGVPRKMNVVCDRAMLAAYGKESFTIDREIIQQAIEEVAGVDHTAETPGQPEKNAQESDTQGSSDGDSGDTAGDERTADLLSRVSQQILAHQIAQQSQQQAAAVQLQPQAQPPYVPYGAPQFAPPPGYAAPGYGAPNYGAPAGYPAGYQQPYQQGGAHSAQSADKGSSGALKFGIFAGIVLVCISLVAAAGVVLYASQPQLFASVFGQGNSGNGASGNNPSGTSARTGETIAAVPAATPSSGASIRQPAVAPTQTPLPAGFLPPEDPMRMAQGPSMPGTRASGSSTNSARPAPRPTPRVGPPDWTVDSRGVVRVSDRRFSRLATELTLVSLVHGAKVNTSRFGDLEEPLLTKLSVVDLPEFQQRGLTKVRLELTCEDALEMGEPLILSFDLPPDSSASPDVLLLSYDKGRRKATLADPRNGMMTLPLTNLLKVYLGATAYFFDSNGWNTLKQGDENDRVESLQNALQRAGAWPGGVGGPDGKFTLFTIQALRNFQRKNRLPVSGEVDTRTVFYLMRGAAPEAQVGDSAGELDEGWVNPDEEGEDITTDEDANTILTGGGLARPAVPELEPMEPLAPLMQESPRPTPTPRPSAERAADAALKEKAAALAAELGLKPRTDSAGNSVEENDGAPQAGKLADEAGDTAGAGSNNE